MNEVAVYLGLLAEVELETWLDKVGGEQSSQALSGKLPVPLSQAVSGGVTHLAKLRCNACRGLLQCSHVLWAPVLWLKAVCS